VELPCLFTA